MAEQCALVIGHKAESPGALNKGLDVSEFEFNNDLAGRILRQISDVRVIRVYRRTYANLPGDINLLEPKFVVSLHCNAFNSTVSGSETLYYHRSENGKRIASIMQKHIVQLLQLKDRGIKPKASEERGGYLLKYTQAPCIIVEPFFIDNDSDLRIARTKIDSLAAAYATAIQEISEIIT